MKEKRKSDNSKEKPGGGSKGGPVKVDRHFAAEKKKGGRKRVTLVATRTSIEKEGKKKKNCVIHS